MWVIKEGINFVYGFDEVHSALIMTTSPGEAKRFRSQREAELWLSQHGNDLEYFRIVDDQAGKEKRGWFSWSDKPRDTSNPEES